MNIPERLSSFTQIEVQGNSAFITVLHFTVTV